MGFQEIPPIEKSQFYIKKAFEQARKEVSFFKAKNRKVRNKLKKSKNIEIKKIEIMTNHLISDLEKIVTNFPTFDTLNLFYNELIETTIGIVEVKKNLAHLGWIKKKIKELRRESIKKKIKELRGDSLRKIKKCNDIEAINICRKSIYGRIASLFKRRNSAFSFLNKARGIFRTFPTLKTDMYTVCIAGLPNVGKSTLLRKISSARPEVNTYPFTTKTLMLGYITLNNKKIQLVDTPGAFRALTEMNSIEKQAYLALKYLADFIIYVFDLTESCGYSVEKQEELFKKTVDAFNNKEIVIFLSKVDLYNKEKASIFSQKYSNFRVISHPQDIIGILSKNI